MNALSLQHIHQDSMNAPSDNPWSWPGALRTAEPRSMCLTVLTSSHTYGMDQFSHYKHASPTFQFQFQQSILQKHFWSYPISVSTKQNNF